MKNKHNIAFKSIETILVAGFIIFEELIWNVLAKPIIDRLNQLAIFERLRQMFLDMNRHGVLTVFIAIFALTEYLGILSGVTIISGEVTTGMMIYLLKAPVAAFTFWLFDLTKPKLMTFAWLASVYSNLMCWKDMLTATTIYQSLKTSVLATKNRIKQIYQDYLGESSLLDSLRARYQLIKTFLIRSQ